MTDPPRAASDTRASDDQNVCPKCDFSANARFEECPQCGVILAKAVLDVGLYQPRSPARDAQPAASLATEANPLDADGKKALLLGAGLALLIFAIPFPRVVLSYLVTLVHELGHAATAILFGYPAIPAFDFLFGGGVTIIFERSLALMALIVAGWAGVFYSVRTAPRVVVAVGCVFALWLFLVWSPLHDALVTAMGHGAELFFGGFFFYRGLTGRGCRSELERMLYHMCAVFLVLKTVRFAALLSADQAFQSQYEQAKGGGHWMDLSRLSDDWLHIDLASVAGLFGALTLLPAIIAYLYVRNEKALQKFAREVLALKS